MRPLSINRAGRIIFHFLVRQIALEIISERRSVVRQSIMPANVADIYDANVPAIKARTTNFVKSSRRLGSSAPMPPI